MHKTIKLIIMPYEKKSDQSKTRSRPQSEMTTPNFSPLEPERA